MLTREKKDQVIAEVKKNIDESSAIFVTNLIGLSANDSVEVRKKIREANGAVVVTRNTLFAKASTGTASEEIFKDLSGPHAAVFAFGEAPEVAKVIYDASKDFEVVTLKQGLLDDKVLNTEEIVALAKLPSRGEMLGTLLATFNAPISAFARVLNAIKEQKEEGGEAQPAVEASQEAESAPETVSEEPAAAEEKTESSEESKEDTEKSE